MNDQTKEALREWFFANRLFFHLSIIGLECGVDADQFLYWVETGKMRPEESALACVRFWATGHGFAGRIPETIRGSFIIPEKYIDDPRSLDYMRHVTAEKMGIEMLERGLLVAEPMRKIPDDFFKKVVFGFRATVLKP